MAKGDGLKVLNAFLKLEGFVEGKNNDNPFGKYYGRNNENYCAFTVSYLAEKAGSKFFQNIKTKDGKFFLTGATSRYCGWCPSIYTYAKSRGILRTDYVKTPPKKGDVILFNMNGRYPDGILWTDHIGIATEDYNPKKGYVETIEANTSSTVKGSQSNGGGIFRKKRYPININGWFSID